MAARKYLVCALEKDSPPLPVPEQELHFSQFRVNAPHGAPHEAVWPPAVRPRKEIRREAGIPLFDDKVQVVEQPEP